MFGRGRGRGFRTTFGDTSFPRPESQLQPNPLYPVMEVKPLPLSGGEQVDYLLALKQEFRGAMRSLPCFIQPPTVRRDVARYSDKYHNTDQQDQDWTPDWKTLPKELRVRPQKPHPSGVKPATVSRRSEAKTKQTPAKKQEKEEVLLKLESLEQKETGSDEEEEEKKQEEEEPEEEEYDEEEFEEETDYIMSYFDNGEGFDGDSDDNMDEAIY